jgi:prolyl 4-hydroxylase
MKLKMSFQWAVFYVALFFVLFFLYWFYSSQESFVAGDTPKGRGYANESDEYEMPVEYPNFITEREADYILATAEPLFEDSLVVSGKDTMVRKSQTAWLPKNDSIVQNIIQRVCDLTGKPFENAEQMQVVKYEPSGYYNEHHDSCCDNVEGCVEFEMRGGQRVITMLLYLSDQFEGGATRFPNLNREYKPPKCGGLLFHPLEKNGGRCHPYALHAGLPVTSGEKYIANIWIRESEHN